MSRAIHAHFDGVVIVPDEPVDLPVGTKVTVQLPQQSDSGHPTSQEIERRLASMKMLAGAFSGPSLSDEALRRDSIYRDDP